PQPAAGGDSRRRLDRGQSRRRGGAAGGAAADGDHADCRPPRDRRCDGRRVPGDRQAVPGRARPGAVVAPIWYHVRDLDAGRDFYTRKLGFSETYLDGDGRWAKLERNGSEIGLAEGEPQGEDGAVAHVG